MSQDYTLQRIHALESLRFSGLSEAQMDLYRHLKRLQYLAELETKKFLDSLIPRDQHLSENDREHWISELKDEQESVTHGDEMCGEAVEDSLRDMSDWEFLNLIKDRQDES